MELQVQPQVDGLVVAEVVVAIMALHYQAVELAAEVLEDQLVQQIMQQQEQ
tara:strand:+ start:380 stop:532 length:153 start_codon:yes stop_codon:yes gene_type:complete